MGPRPARGRLQLLADDLSNGVKHRLLVQIRQPNGLGRRVHPLSMRPNGER